MLLCISTFVLARKLTIIVPDIVVPDPRELIPEKITLSGEFFNKKNIYLALEKVEESYPNNIIQTDKDGNDIQIMVSGAYKVHKTMTKEQMGF